MSKHALLAPSCAHRWLHCPRAPRLEAKLPRKESIYADEGTLAHKVCEIAAKVHFHQATGEEYRQTIEQLKQDTLWSDEMQNTAGLYVAYLADRAAHYKEKNPRVEIEARVDITEYVPDGFGRCDCLMLCGRTLIIADYKHGRGVPVSAQQNPQMMLYALGALNREKHKEKIKAVEIGIVQPRINFFEKWHCRAKDLLAWGEAIKPKAQMAYEGKGDFHAGEWCRFCRALGICEATRKEADQ